MEFLLGNIYSNAMEIFTKFNKKKLFIFYFLVTPTVDLRIGRSLQNAIVNLGLEDSYSSALRGLGIKLEELYEEEQDAGLGMYP